MPGLCAAKPVNVRSCFKRWQPKAAHCLANSHISHSYMPSGIIASSEEIIKTKICFASQARLLKTEV